MWPTLEFLRTITVQLTKKKFCPQSRSSIKRGIWHFHAVVVQWWQRIVEKGVMHVQSCFASSFSFSSSDIKTPNVWKTWWASFVYPHFKGVEGDLGMFQGQFSKQYPFLNRKGNVWTNENYSKTSRLYKKYQTTLTTLPIRENFECPFVVLQIILVTVSLAISFLSDCFYQRTIPFE